MEKKKEKKKYVWIMWLKINRYTNLCRVFASESIALKMAKALRENPSDCLASKDYFVEKHIVVEDDPLPKVVAKELEQ